MIRVFSVLQNKIHTRLSRYDELARNRGKILTGNSMNGIAGNLVGGNFLTGLLLYFDATTAQIGILNIIVSVCNMLQIFSPLLIERFSRRKPILIASRIVIHVLNVIMVGLIAVLPSESQTKVMAILGIQAVLNIVSASTAQGFSVWHIQSIPEDKRANYFAMSNIISNAAIYTFLLGGSWLLDWFKSSDMELEGMLWLRVVAVLFAALDIFFLCKTREYPYIKSEEKPSLKMIFTAPFREKRYMISVLLVFLWSAFGSTTGSYYTVYLLQDLNASYLFLNVVGAMYVPIAFFMGPVWVRYINRSSWLGVLYKTMLCYGPLYGCQAFVTADWIWLYAVIIMLCYLFTSGLNIVFANMPYYNIPEKNQSVYLAFYTAVNMVGSVAGQYYATMFMTMTEGFSFSLFGMRITTAQIAVFVTGVLVVVTGVIVFFTERYEKWKYPAVLQTENSKTL